MATETENVRRRVGGGRQNRTGNPGSIRVGCVRVGTDIVGRVDDVRPIVMSGVGHDPASAGVRAGGSLRGGVTSPSGG